MKPTPAQDALLRSLPLTYKSDTSILWWFEMSNEKLDRLNERMKDLLNFYHPSIVERYKAWESRDRYLPLGINSGWIGVNSNVVECITDAAKALCAEQEMGAGWIPDWIQKIKDTALDEGNVNDVETIIKNWKDYYR